MVVVLVSHVTTLETLLGLPGADAAELDFGVPLSGRSVRKMVLEGAELTPITVDGKGNPLYVGRMYRGAPPKMKRALELRDRHCRAPGCTKPVEWCQGEHRIPFSEGGTTDIENMRLYCAGHNWLKAQGYEPERRPDGRIFWVEVRPPEGYGAG